MARAAARVCAGPREPVAERKRACAIFATSLRVGREQTGIAGVA